MKLVASIVIIEVLYHLVLFLLLSVNLNLSINKSDTRRLTFLTDVPLKLSCVPSLKIYGSNALKSNEKGLH